jgi:putative ABC transport system permease protein
MLFVNIQYNYIRNKDWGIQTENVLYLQTQSYRGDINPFLLELKRNPNIVDVTAASYYPGEFMQRWIQDFEGVSTDMTVWPVKYNFFDFFGVSVIEGKGFQENDEKKMILNQTFSEKYGFYNMEGKEISGYDIIGKVKDFNYKSLHNDIQPLAFIKYEYEWIGYKWVFVKTDGANTKQTAEYIHDTWKKFSNISVEVLSLTGTIQSLYKKERNTASLISICGAIAIIVAIIGLYGLILFDAKAKRKSIAIRKIHGASISEIMLILNQSLFVRFTAACLIAFPLSYYAVHRWLEDFAYKTPLYWWVFALGGLVVLIIALLTVSWESYKAARVNPAEMVKAE